MGDKQIIDKALYVKCSVCGEPDSVCEDCDGDGEEKMPCEPDDTICEGCDGTGRVFKCGCVE